LFTNHEADNHMSLLVYVDDLVLKGNDAKTCAQFKEYLSDVSLKG